METWQLHTQKSEVWDTQKLGIETTFPKSEPHYLEHESYNSKRDTAKWAMTQGTKWNPEDSSGTECPGQVFRKGKLGQS